MTTIDLFNPAFSYQSMDDKSIFSIMNLIRNGIKYTLFSSFASKRPISLQEWSSYLHISERTLQRYQKEGKTFDSLQSEKIVEIVLLYKKGVEVFGNEDYFNTWLISTNIALGGIKPKELFDNSFGLKLLQDELGRIEHGVLA